MIGIFSHTDGKRKYLGREGADDGNRRICAFPSREKSRAPLEKVKGRHGRPQSSALFARDTE